MNAGYRVLTPGIARTSAREFATDVLVGLCEKPKRLPSRWFYDDEGSRLFARICDVPEYYLTRTEHEILRTHAARIMGAFGDAPFNLVDLGAGDGRKTATLLEQAARAGLPCRYVPIDVSEAAMEGLVAATRGRFPGLEVEGIVSEYTVGIEWLADQGGRKNLVLFLGSNVGNFDRPGAARFLRRLWHALDPDDRVLIGFDLKKDPEQLLRAYNDAEGVTRQFNLNLLKRINRELGGQFDLTRFTHFGTWDPLAGAMSSYLLSLERQEVEIAALGRSFRFEPWEPILTEYSFKFLEADVRGLAGETGYAVEELLWDDRRRFCDALWRVIKTAPGA